MQSASGRAAQPYIDNKLGKKEEPKMHPKEAASWTEEKPVDTAHK